MKPRHERSGVRGLLLSASVGGGHLNASRAVAAALQRATAGLMLSERDYIGYLPGWLRLVTADLYPLLLRHCPALWRYYYRWTSRAGGTVGPRWLVRKVGASTGLFRIKEELDTLCPDLVVSLFTQAATLVEAARIRVARPFLHAVVVTDYRPHRHWAVPGVDLLITPTAQAKEDLLSYGVEAARIRVAGIPVREEFRQMPVREAARRQLCLDKRPALLVSGGAGAAYRSQERVLDLLRKLDLPVQAICVSGAEGASQDQGRVRILRLGFRQDYPQILSACDLLVGKAGGMTVAEACVAGTPMLIYDPIPGQEEGNAAYLEAQGAALWPRDGAALSALLAHFLTDPQRLGPLRENASRLAVANASEQVAQLLLTELAARGTT